MVLSIIRLYGRARAVERLTLGNQEVAECSATCVIIGGICHVPRSLFRRRLRSSHGSATLVVAKRVPNLLVPPQRRKSLRLPLLHLKSSLTDCVKFGKVPLRQFLQRMSTLLPEFLYAVAPDRRPPDPTTPLFHQRE